MITYKYFISIWKLTISIIQLICLWFIVFTCVGALAIAGALHHVDFDLLGWWLCERQVKNGGLNGRPEKLPDVCNNPRSTLTLSLLRVRVLMSFHTLF